MSTTSETSRAKRLRGLFLKLHTIMDRERESNWIQSIGNIIAILDEVDADQNVATDRIAEAHHCFRSMNAGNGSFSDFYIWRNEFTERIEANNEVTSLTESIWREFELNA